MNKGKKLIFIGIVLCLLGGIGIYKYMDISHKKDYSISDVKWDGEARWWTSNTRGNEYNIKFKFFNGKDIKKITSKKSNYIIKIDSAIEDGDLNIKIYDDKKTLFNKNGTLNESITISNRENKDIKIEITAEKAKGSIKLKAI